MKKLLATHVFMLLALFLITLSVHAASTDVPERLQALLEDESATFVKIEHKGVLFFFDTGIIIRQELIDRAHALGPAMSRVHWTTRAGRSNFLWRDFPRYHEVIEALMAQAIVWEIEADVSAKAANDSAHLPIVAGMPSIGLMNQWVDDWPGLTDFEQYVVQFVNEYRVENGRQPLEICPVLSALAWYRVSYLNRNGFIRADVESGDVHRWGSHTSMDIRRLSEEMANRSSGGVNFQSRHVGFTTYHQARRTVDGWINSRSHRTNMLNRRIAFIGAGTSLSVCGNHTYIYNFFG